MLKTIKNVILFVTFITFNSIFGESVEITAPEHAPTIVATSKARVMNQYGPENLLAGSTSNYWDAGDSGTQEVEIRWKFLHRKVNRIEIYDKDPSTAKKYYFYGSAFTPMEGNSYFLMSSQNGETPTANPFTFNIPANCQDVRRVMIKIVPVNSAQIVKLNYIKIYEDADYLPATVTGTDNFNVSLESVTDTNGLPLNMNPKGWVYIKATFKPGADINKDFYFTLTGKYKSNTLVSYAKEDYSLFQSKFKPSPGTSTWLANQQYTCTFLTWIPEYAPPGLDIDCVIEGRNGNNTITVTPNGAIKTVHVTGNLPSSPYTTRNFSKEIKGDRTVYLFNGRYLSGRHIEIQQKTLESLYTAFKAGYHIYVLGDINPIVSNSGNNNISSATNFFNCIDRQCNILLSYDPDAIIMPSLVVRPKLSYVDANPNDKPEFPNGTIMGTATAASGIFEGLANDVIGKIMNNFNNAYYKNNIIGYQLLAQSDLTFKWWCSESKNGAILKGRTDTLMGADCCLTLQDAFRSYLNTKYLTDEAWRSAWQIIDLSKTIDNFDPIVQTALMLDPTDHGLTFVDPAKNIPVNDYIDYKSQRMYEFRESLSQTIKSGGTFAVQMHSYGPLTPIFDAGFMQHGEGMSYATIVSSNIDSQGECHGYYYRRRNDHYAHRVFNGSMQVNNHIAWTEHDNRTYLSAIEDYKEYSKTGTLELNKMYFGADLCMGMAGRMYNFDSALTGQGSILWNSDYDFSINEYNHALIDDWSASRDYHSNKDLAVIISYKSSGYYDLLAKLPDHNRIHNMLLTELNRTGIPYDLYHLEDIDKSRLKDSYKAYIFLNSDALTSVQRSAIINNYRKDGKTLMWFYAPGYVDLDQHVLFPSRVPTVTGITGMNLRSADSYSTITVDNNNAYWQGDPDIPNEIAINPAYSNNQYFTQAVSPVFSTENDNGAGHIKLGVYEGTTYNGLSVKSFASPIWTSVFCGIPYMPREMLKRILINSGCHCYSDSKDIYINASRDWLVVRNLKDSSQSVTINLGSSGKPVWDIYAKQKIYDNVGSFSMSLNKYQTKLYYTGTEDIQTLLNSFK